MEAFDAQHAAKLSAEELQQLTKELFNWSKDAKQKAARKAPAAQPTPAAATPGQSHGSQQQQQQASGAARHPAGHTYEHYRDKWDKFDVDAAMAAEEEEARGGASVNGTHTGSTPHRHGASGTAGPSGASSHPMAIPEAKVTVPVGPSPLRKTAPGSTAPQKAAPAPCLPGDWKDAGNEHFKQGRYRQAIECYTTSLEMEPGCLAAANRAMARLKMGQHEAAEQDCSLALQLCPGYVKAHQRRATARRQLGNLLGAVEDCESVLRLEPNNKQAAIDRDTCVCQLLQQRGLPAPSCFEEVPVRLVQPAATPTQPATAQTPPAPAPAPAPAAAAAVERVGAPSGSTGDEFLRVSSVQRSASTAGPTTPEASTAAHDAGSPPTAQQVAGTQAAQRTPPAAAPTALIQVVGADASDDSTPDLVEPLAATPEAAAAVVSVAAPAQQEQERAQDTAPEQSQQSKQALAGPELVLRATAEDCQQPVEQTMQQQSAVSAGTTAAAPDTGGSSCQLGAVDAPAAAGPAGASLGDSASRTLQERPTVLSRSPKEPAPFKKPRTGVEFEKAWKGLKGDTQPQAAYLLALPPAQLPALLKQALSPALLAAVTSALLRPALQQQPAAAVALLDALTGVARFDINLMSVPPLQKADLRDLWDTVQTALATADGELASRLAEVQRKYKL